MARRARRGIGGSLPEIRQWSNQPSWHAQPVEEVLDRLETLPDGLSDDDAAHGSLDTAPTAYRRPTRVGTPVLLDQFHSIVVVLLIAAAGISLALGDLLEAVAIGAVLVINTLIGFAMELRARRAMEAILGLDVPIASVVRAGRLQTIPAARSCARQHRRARSRSSGARGCSPDRGGRSATERGAVDRRVTSGVEDGRGNSSRRHGAGGSQEHGLQGHDGGRRASAGAL